MGGMSDTQTFFSGDFSVDFEGKRTNFAVSAKISRKVQKSCVWDLFGIYDTNWVKSRYVNFELRNKNKKEQFSHKNRGFSVDFEGKSTNFSFYANFLEMYENRDFRTFWHF